MDKKELNSMFENLLHIGNKTNHWNPKMKDYIYGSSNGVHVFNLIKTADQITKVKTELADLAKQWKKVLFVSTKLQARDAFSKLAVETNNYFVNEKWVPGLLTNFKTIKKRINTYLQLLKESSNGSLDILTKKEKAYKLLELEKLDRAFKGVKEMKRLPDVVFVVDGGYELQAVKEAKSLNLPCYALANTNTNPDLVTNLIPANTNSIKSIEYIAAALKDVVKSTGAPVKGSGFKKMEHKKPLASKPVVKKEEAAKPVVKKEEKTVEKNVPAKKAPAKKETQKADDLTKVEGIGPKTAEAIIAAGVKTFADLAKKTSKEITEMISEVRGSHVTDTWAEQAGMAAAGKWDELKVWQDEHDGGKPAA